MRWSVLAQLDSLSGGHARVVGEGVHTSARCPCALTMLVPWRVARSRDVHEAAARRPDPVSFSFEVRCVLSADCAVQ